MRVSAFLFVGGVIFLAVLEIISGYDHFGEDEKDSAISKRNSFWRSQGCTCNAEICKALSQQIARLQKQMKCSLESNEASDEDTDNDNRNYGWKFSRHRMYPGSFLWR